MGGAAPNWARVHSLISSASSLHTATGEHASSMIPAYLMRDAIREAIRGHQRPSMAIRAHLSSSEAIGAPLPWLTRAQKVLREKPETQSGREDRVQMPVDRELQGRVPAARHPAVQHVERSTPIDGRKSAAEGKVSADGSVRAHSILKQDLAPLKCRPSFADAATTSCLHTCERHWRGAPRSQRCTRRWTTGRVGCGSACRRWNRSSVSPIGWWRI